MTDGTAQFLVPGLSKSCHTWYKVFGDLQGPAIPLIVLHGGPGACHDYLLPLTDLFPSIPLVFYDQIGNGHSTHLPEKAGDEAFWSVTLFSNELDNLISHLKLTKRPIDVYGHSWGGMLAAVWAATSASSNNLRRLVISNSLASMDSWRVGITKLRRRLPADVQGILDHAEDNGEFESPEYESAVEVFYKRHLSLARPWPSPEVKTALDWFAKDSTTYNNMQVRPYLSIRSLTDDWCRYGPSELCITGSLRNWTAVPLLKKIKVPTLLLNGSEDEAQDEAMQPFFTHISKVKWITLDGAAHFSHVDKREKYIKHLRDFLMAQLLL
jgi:proline-specific peptidase